MLRGAGQRPAAVGRGRRAAQRPARARRGGAAALDDIREESEAVSARADQLADQDAQRDAERRAQMDEAGSNEPVVHEPRPSHPLSPPGGVGDSEGYYEPDVPEPVAEIGDAEAEMEL